MTTQMQTHEDPARALTDGAFVPVQTRSERPRSFEPADFGTPTGREVNWKHTPIARLTPLFTQATANDGVSYSFSSGAEYRSAGLRAGDAQIGRASCRERV